MKGALGLPMIWLYAWFHVFVIMMEGRTCGLRRELAQPERTSLC
jgi:hypothetical protein